MKRLIKTIFLRKYVYLKHFDQRKGKNEEASDKKFN